MSLAIEKINHYFFDDKFLVTIKSHLFWPLFSSSFVKNPRQHNGCLRFLPRLIKK